MKYLLNDRLNPITRSYGFIEKETNDLVNCFMSWHREINERLSRSKRSEFKVSKLDGSLEQVLLNLLPLCAGGEDRYLFIPTKSRWTAYFANGLRGTDPTAIRYLAKRCDCRTIWIVATPFIMKKEESRGFEGALILELFGPEDTGTMSRNLLRSIRLEKDIGKWSFTEDGTPLSFERLDKYELRYKKDRFTLDMMNEYLLEFGIIVFQEEFYLPSGTKATLIREKTTYELLHLSLYGARHYYDKNKFS
jgi:hypothetical protein